MAAIIVTSFAASLLIDNAIIINDFHDVLNYVFTILILLTLVHSFKKYEATYIIDNVFLKKIPMYMLIFILSIVFIVNIQIVYTSINYIILNEVSITEYKNQGLANEMIRIMNPSYLVFIANFLSPLGFLALGLHFYLITKRKIALSAIFFVLSFNIVLQSLHGLSRFGIVLYALVYFGYYLYCYNSIPKDLKKVINLIILTFIIIVFSVVIVTSYARFSEDAVGYIERDGRGLVTNPVALSILEYYSQWISNGILTMKEFSYEKLWYGKSSSPLLLYILSIIGYETITYTDTRIATLGDFASSFNGLVSTLVYDFGYIVTIFLTCVFFFVVRKLRPKNGAITLTKFLYFSVLSPVILLFFTNHAMSSIMLQLGLLYIVIFSILSRLR